MRTMYQYFAYGLTIASELALPELIPSNGVANVVIQFGRLSPPALHPTPSYCSCHITAQEAYLAWADGGVFYVQDGYKIVVDPIAGVDERILRLYLLGAALGLLLHQRGLMVLHANTVVVKGHAIAVVAERGYGKSTTTGALYHRGHELLADDVTAIAPLDQELLALPGFPRLKLWPESVVALGQDPTTLPLLHPELEKRDRTIEQGFAQRPVPLSKIYLLEDGDQLEVQPLPPGEAIATLMRHWYCSRFGAAMLEVIGTKSHFLQCASLARRVPVYALKRPYNLSALMAIAQLVEEHVTSDCNAVV